ncbi:MAG: hypothetical protein V4812_12515 [Pseudomonadota bacterium]
MSQATNPTAAPVLNATIDTYDIATGASEYLRWLSALMVAIHCDIKHNEGRKAADLAQMGQYLADDHLNDLGREVQQLKLRLQAEGFDA